MKQMVTVLPAVITHHIVATDTLCLQVLDDFMSVKVCIGFYYGEKSCFKKELYLFFFLNKDFIIAK